MAATIKNRTKPSDPLYAKTRAKIQTSQLVNRLQANALGELPEDLTTSRLRSIEILLSKTLPSLQSTEISGEVKTGLDEETMAWLDKR